MGGRGAYSQRIRGVVAPRRNVALGAGGGGAATEKPATLTSAAGGGGTIDTPFGKYEVVSFSHNGKSHQKPNKTDGQLTLRDSKGNTIKSIQVSSGSTRTTFEFENFALKFEGVVRGAGFPGQNAKDFSAYQNLHPRLKQYAAKVLNKNKKVTLNLNGNLKEVQVITVERVVPFKGDISERRYAQLYRQYKRLTLGKYGGKRINDIRLPDRDGNGGHNIYFARKANGKPIIKAFDIPFGQ